MSTINPVIKTFLDNSSILIKDFDSLFSQKYELIQPISVIFEMSETQGDERKLTFCIFDDHMTGIKVSSVDHKELYKIALTRPPHRHDSWEFMYVLDGAVKHHVDKISNLYPKGSCCLLCDNVNHREEFTTDFRAIFITVSNDLLLKTLRDDIYRNDNGRIIHYNQSLLSDIAKMKDKLNRKEFIDFLPIASQPNVTEEIEDLLDKLGIEMSVNKSGHVFFAQAMLSRFFSIISNHNYYLKFINKIDATSEETLFARITQLIEQNNGRIKRESLESILNYSADHLNRVAKKYSGMNLVELGQHICLHHAATMLKETDMKIAEILEYFGYSNRTYFNKIFQMKYHVSPRDYRKLSREG